MEGKPGPITEKHELWINFSIVHRLKKPIAKNAFLQPAHVPTKHQLPMSYTVAGVTILGPSVPHVF